MTTEPAPTPNTTPSTTPAPTTPAPAPTPAQVAAPSPSPAPAPRKPRLLPVTDTGNPGYWKLRNGRSSRSGASCSCARVSRRTSPGSG